MWTRLRIGRTIAVVQRSCASNSNKYGMYGTRLNLARAYDCLWATRFFRTTCATTSFRTLIHVQLTGLSRTTATSGNTATPGTLHTFPHALHSTAGVPLTFLFYFPLTPFRPCPLLPMLPAPVRRDGRETSHPHSVRPNGAPSFSPPLLRAFFPLLGPFTIQPHCKILLG